MMIANGKRSMNRPNKKGRISAALSVELPGIEPATKIALTSGNAGSEYR
jgi:hypothetical protein